MEVTVRIRTEKPVGVAAYLEEILKQMKQNKYFSIAEYEVKKKKK